MAIANTHCLVLAMLIVAGTLILDDHRVAAQLQCALKIPSLISQCKQYVEVSGPKIPPSPECCSVVKSVNVPCICKYVTPDLEKIVSMEKVVYVAQTCGITVQPGQKCGSYTAPPKA